MKVLLFPFALILEPTLIILCYFISIISPTIALKITEKCIQKLPNKEWYFG